MRKPNIEKESEEIQRDMHYKDKQKKAQSTMHVAWTENPMVFGSEKLYGNHFCVPSWGDFDHQFA